MRPKVVIAVLFLALGLLGIIVLIPKGASQAPTSASKSDEPSVTNAAAQIEPVAQPKTEPVVSTVTAPVAPPSVSVTNHAEYISKRNAELMNLAMNNDSASMETILSEMHNPDRQIRKGALEAIIQFDDRAAIPRLKEIAAQTEDEEEKKDILEAADYINLPSLSEYVAQQQAQRQAIGITNPPSQSPRPRPTRFTGNPRPRQQVTTQPSAPAQPQAAP